MLRDTSIKFRLHRRSNAESHMESNLVGVQDRGDRLSAGEGRTSTAANSVEPGQDGVVGTARPGSLSLMESLEIERRESARSPAKADPEDVGANESPTAPPTTRPLPKALQPKETRRGSSPGLPTHTSVYRVTTGHQSSSGINVSESVIRQQRRSNASDSPTSPTDRSPLQVSPKPEAVSGRPETEMGGSVGSRFSTREENVGAAPLRALQRQHVTKETAKSYRPEVERMSGTGYRSRPFSDLLSVFQTPSSTNSTSGPKPASSTTTPSKYSKFNKFAYDDRDHSSTHSDDPIQSSDSVSNAAFDPSPTISRLLRKQRNVSAEQKQPETQSSCPEPSIPVTEKSVIEIRNSVTSPIGKEEKSDVASSTSTTSDPIELSPNSDDLSATRSLDVEFRAGLHEITNPDHDLSKLTASDVEAGTKMVKETGIKVTDDDDDEDKVKELSVSDVMTSDVKDLPTLPTSVPASRVDLPLDHEEEEADHDEDR